jgi:glutathione S-transferase
MITVFGEGRGFRVVWLLEEMGLAYRLRPVDLGAGVENDAEFLAVNPAGFIPAIQDGDVTMVESIAIMEYLMARHGPTPLAPEPHDPAFPMYQQFLHLGEASSSCTWVKPASRWALTSSAAPAISPPRPSETTGAPARRWRCSRAGWDW